MAHSSAKTQPTKSEAADPEPTKSASPFDSAVPG
jgi:hypothetical protein